uniref:Uncharacterized protein n=1 Tax=Pristionchus pacificus TaxID=54126 RepID=A0A2A6CCV3_PRIPA|eukprot:PDM76032.1 hypothetical protein PRIPAC_39636 [Pristionchus pacificus]
MRAGQQSEEITVGRREGMDLRSTFSRRGCSSSNIKENHYQELKPTHGPIGIRWTHRNKMDP